MRLSGLPVKVICLLLIGAMLFSCARYSYYEVPKQPPPSFEGRSLRLYYPEKPELCYVFGNLWLSGEELHGKLELLASPIETKSENIIKAYLKSGLAIPDSTLSDFRLPMADIDRLEVYDLNLGKTVFVSTLAFAGTSALALSVLTLIILLTKESCPFVYCYNGEEFEFTGEIYSGAIFPNLERDDYMPLPVIQPKDGYYQLKMDNLAEEIQYTNLAELWVVDHPVGSTLYVDRHGNYYTVRSPVLPLSAISGDNKDKLALLTAKDDAKYLGDDQADENSPYDVLDLQFRVPHTPNEAKLIREGRSAERPYGVPATRNEAKLILKARNSIWLDKTLGQFLDMFGSKYDAWYSRQAKPDNSLDPDWALKQGIPLSVYVKKDGAWQLVDYFPVVGPMADRDLIMPIDLSGIQEDKVEIRLKGGAKFWEIDYAAMDFSKQETIHPQKLGLRKAITTEGKEVTKLLTQSDKKYFVQPRVGDSAMLQYVAPTSVEDMNRTVFLHSRGHYKVIRKAKGEPDIARLEQFRTPGSFASFSRRNYLEFLSKYSLNK